MANLSDALSCAKQRKSSPGSQVPLKPISGASLPGGPVEIKLLASIDSYVSARVSVKSSDGSSYVSHRGRQFETE